jgi:hypothetical protein
MDYLIRDSKKALSPEREALRKSTPDAVAMMGAFASLGFLGKIVFVCVPAGFGNGDDETKMCYDTVQCLVQSSEDRHAEFNAEYLSGALAVFTKFLSNLLA